MQWTPGGTSGDIEDRRDSSGGGGGGFGFGGMHLGIGGTLILLVLSFIFKDNLFNSVSTGPAPAPATSADRSRDAAEQPEVQFISFVLDDVQHVWELRPSPRPAAIFPAPIARRSTALRPGYSRFRHFSPSPS